MQSLTALDTSLLDFFGSLQRPWLDPVVRGLTHLGDFWLLGSLALVFTIGLAVRGYRWSALGFALLCLFSLGLERTVKHLVQRPRPDVAWRLIDLPREPSFPSGHSLCSMAIYLTAGLILSQMWGRRWPALVGLLLGFVVGLTRPYLGVHYPLDVVSGWVGGLVCAFIVVPLLPIPGNGPTRGGSEKPAEPPIA